MVFSLSAGTVIFVGIAAPIILKLKVSLFMILLPLSKSVRSIFSDKTMEKAKGVTSFAWRT